jgi:LPS O-antigen subunit length determinant protein (WzzB/FepE family)
MVFLHAEEDSIMMRVFSIVTLAGVVAVIGCERQPADPASQKVTSEDVRRDASQAVTTAAEFSQQAKEDFQKSLDARLQALDAEIARLGEKGRDLKDKVDWDRKLAELETKREAARVKLDELGRSSADAWKDVQKGAQAAWDELDKTFREATSEF